MARSKLVVLLLLLSLVTMANAQPGKPANKEKCKDKKYASCFNYQMECPYKCPWNCYIDCATCKPVCACDVPGAICQDPRFIGADGITFYFHGNKDKDFCLVSDSDFHINAHFIGRRNAEISRDFTWIQSIGLLFGDHKVYLGALKTSTWDNAEDRVAISFDGEPVVLSQEVGAVWKSAGSEPAVTIVRSTATNGITVEVEGLLKITAKVVPITAEESRVHNYGITDDDCFAHLELSFKFYSLTNDVHGVLGQTYRESYVSRVKMSSTMPIMSGEHKYASSSIFSTDCKVARFGLGGGAGIAMVAEQPDLNCHSRFNGRGIVCKR